MKETKNLKLKKPDPEDFYNVEDFNSNMDLLDADQARQDEAILQAQQQLNEARQALTIATQRLETAEQAIQGHTTAIQSHTGNGIIHVTQAEKDGWNAKAATGPAGTPAGFGTPTATVDNNTGTPSVTVTTSGPNTAKVFNFQFKNLKGATGATGPRGATGPAPDTSKFVTKNELQQNVYIGIDHMQSSYPVTVSRLYRTSLYLSIPARSYILVYVTKVWQNSSVNSAGGGSGLGINTTNTQRDQWVPIFLETGYANVYGITVDYIVILIMS